MMTIDADDHVLEELAAEVHAIIQSHKQLLTTLDQAIGDGDHGQNLSRGFAAVNQERADYSSKSFGHACIGAGKALVMHVGGASGPLYGSCIMAFGQAIDHTPETREELIRMLEAGVQAIKNRGRSDAGAKTMLDVLIPLLDALKQGDIRSFSQARAIAQEAADDTRSILATKGRAAYLGARSLGHVDPGARSTALIVEAICNYYEARS